MNKLLHGAILILLMTFSLSKAQSITVSNTSPGAAAVYTFNYTAPQAIGTGTSIPNVFYLWLPSGYPAISPVVSGGAGLQPYVTFKVNGITYPCNTAFGSVGGSWASGIQLSTGGASTGVSIPAGAQIQVVVSGLIKNPTNSGNYNFLWRISQSNGASVQDYNVPISFSSTLAVNETSHKQQHIIISPNPSSDFIRISGLSQNQFYQIYSAAGVLVGEGKISGDEKIDIKNLINGIYTLRTGDHQTVKFIKK